MYQYRYSMWAGQGLPIGWARQMGLPEDEIGDVVWPIVDDQTCGPINGSPRPEQMLCWCPSSEKQRIVFALLNDIDL